MSALELKNQLADLQAEKALATVEGLDGSVAYMADLEDEIGLSRHLYVCAAVTEIATLRAELSGPQEGGEADVPALLDSYRRRAHRHRCSGHTRCSGPPQDGYRWA